MNGQRSQMGGFSMNPPSDGDGPSNNPGRDGSYSAGYALSLPIPAGIVPNTWSVSDGPENEGIVSLSSPGNAGVTPRYTENGTLHPIGTTQGNGVRMPPPMSSGFEPGWGFNDDGRDMHDVTNFVPYIQGVQLPGGASENEIGWNFGADFSNQSPHEQEPPTNQNFGVFEGDGVFSGGATTGSFYPDGDDTVGGMHMVGRMPMNNYDMVGAGDILPTFGGLTSDGGQGTHGGSGTIPGGSMQGIPVSYGSTTYDGPGGNPFGAASAAAAQTRGTPYGNGGDQSSYPAWSGPNLNGSDGTRQGF